MFFRKAFVAASGDEADEHANITATTARRMENTPQGICPDGWHIPKLKEYLALVGKSTDPNVEVNTDAPYYDADLKGASLKALNDDGFNLYPFPYVNGGTKFQASVLNKSTEGDFVDYAEMASMSYFLASTSRSATQDYGMMISNLAAKTIASVGYNNLPNGVAIRCIKNK